MSGYLLDTHAALWWWIDSPRLGENARRLIEESTARICLSVVSVWEIGIKVHSGRLTAIPSFRTEYPALLAANGFDLIPITDRHALEAAYLDAMHRDPFDRMIAGQARCEEMIVITRDTQIAALGCETLW